MKYVGHRLLVANKFSKLDFSPLIFSGKVGGGNFSSLDFSVKQFSSFILLWV